VRASKRDGVVSCDRNCNCKHYFVTVVERTATNSRENGKEKKETKKYGAITTATYDRFGEKGKGESPDPARSTSHARASARNEIRT